MKEHDKNLRKVMVSPNRQSTGERIQSKESEEDARFGGGQAKIKKMQEMFNKDLIKLQNKERNNTIIEIKDNRRNQ